MGTFFVFIVFCRTEFFCSHCIKSERFFSAHLFLALYKVFVPFLFDDRFDLWRSIKIVIIISGLINDKYKNISESRIVPQTSSYYYKLNKFKMSFALFSYHHNRFMVCMFFFFQTGRFFEGAAHIIF